MVSSAVESGPRYAPTDSSLPAPWKALVDGKTGYLYYWNTETNSTQYEKPVPPPLPPGPPQTVSSSGQKMGGGGGALRSSDSQTPRTSNYNGGTSQGGGGQYHSQGGGGGAPLSSQSGFGGSPHPQPTGSSRGGYSSSGQLRGSGNPPPAQSPSVYSSRIGSGGHVQGSSLSSVIGSIHGTNNNATTSSQPQPRLASIPPPRGQQGMGPQTNAHSHISVGHQNNVAIPLVPSGTGPPPILRRSANYAPDPYKRSQDQGFFEPTTTGFTDVQAYMRQNEVTVLGDNVPPPFMTFDATGFPPEIMKEFRMAGFVAPTPVQAQSWPVALQSRDIVAIAKTGSGKTLGYLLPAFLHVARIRANSKLGPSVLVLAPTRELATQIQEEAVKFGRPMRISSTCVYGGAPKGPQLRDLERGADIVIATPGRLNDYLEARKVNLRQTTYLVLDEADRMLDMGFEPQIRKIVREIPPRRQTLMYTATWPKEVRKIAEDLLVNPVHVSIGNSDELTVNKAITQFIECMPPYEKQRRLEQILQGQEPGSKILIFCSTKKMCEQLSRILSRVFRAAAIHGDKSQSERDYVLAQFKQGRCPILVATDVAARGLDIKDIRVVINYDFPTGIEDYVHRIGRTGRAGAVGMAYTFFSEQDAKYARELVKVMERANQKIPLELRDIAARSSHLKGRSGKWGEGGGGSRGSRDGGGRSQFGGRGGSNSFAAAWPPPASAFGRQEKPFDKFGDRERLGDRDRRTDDGNRGRGGMGRRFGGGRGRDRSLSRSPSGGGDRSRSRSRSHDNLYHQSVPSMRGGGGVPRHRDVGGNQSMATVGALPSRQSKGEIRREVSPELVRPRGDMPLQRLLASPGDHLREDALPRIGSVLPSPVPKEEPLRVALPKDVSPKTMPVTSWVPSYDSSPGMVVDTSICAQAEEMRSAVIQGGLP